MVAVAERFRLLIVSQGYISSNLIGHPIALVAQRKSTRFLPGFVISVSEKPPRSGGGGKETVLSPAVEDYTGIV